MSFLSTSASGPLRALTSSRISHAFFQCSNGASRQQRPYTRYAPTRLTCPSQRARCLHASSRYLVPSAAPKSKDRGPVSEEDTQTDFGAMNILSNTPAPTTGIDACSSDGFALNSGLKIVGSGVVLVGGEAFAWKPWIRGGSPEDMTSTGTKGGELKGSQAKGAALINPKGQWDVQEECWGLLSLVWPKPDLLILGTGPGTVPVSPATRKHINDLGIRLEIQDTRNAAAQFNLLATERGVQQVAAALVPIGWRDSRQI
ncbi:hypothetical protein LTR28_007650 [Elasticomyces elasticus]|nr:hypothetical protein LTR28_007650 [Elasticomyces elasticus]